MTVTRNERDGDLRGWLEAMRAGTRVPGLGVALVEDGEVTQAVATGAADASSGRAVHEGIAFHACSMSKMVTAVGVLRLVQQGVLELTADVDTSLIGGSLPRARAAAGSTVTLAHLLAHESGVSDPDGSFEPARGVPPRAAEVLRGSTSAHPGAVTVARTPGVRFDYSDAGYCVVEQVVEDVTGVPFAHAMRELVLAPLGLARTAFWDGSPGSVPAGLGDPCAGHDARGDVVPGGRAHYPGLAAAGLWSTPHDLAVLLADLMAAWAGGTGATLLTAETAGAMLTPGCEPTVGLGVFLPADGGETCVQSQGWGVGFQCLLRAYPGRGGAVVAMIDADPGVSQGASLVGEVVEALATERGWPV